MLLSVVTPGIGFAGVARGAVIVGAADIVASWPEGVTMSG